MFLSQSIREQAISFTVSTENPNRRLRKALKESDQIISGKKKVKSYDSFADALKDLNIE